MTETGHQPFTPRGDRWSRRPRRSRADSKVAGVAGGLGRYLGVDPILFRVGFVALTILGGAGVLAYCVLWLLLPADGDDVSAGESLIGRGRSSMSPALAVGLAIAIVISVTSSFSWGLPFWPALVVAVIAFHIARRQRRGPFRPGSDWEQRWGSQHGFNRAHWSGGQPWYGQDQSAGEPGRQNQYGQNQYGQNQQQQHGLRLPRCGLPRVRQLDCRWVRRSRVRLPPTHHRVVGGRAGSIRLRLRRRQQPVRHPGVLGRPQR